MGAYRRYFGAGSRALPERVAVAYVDTSLSLNYGIIVSVIKRITCTTGGVS